MQDKLVFHAIASGLLLFAGNGWAQTPGAPAQPEPSPAPSAPNASTPTVSQAPSSPPPGEERSLSGSLSPSTNPLPAAVGPSSASVGGAPALSEAAPPAVNREAPLESGPVPVKGLWNPVIYGFVEFDAIHDSTQSFGAAAGNTAVARAGSMAGDHPRTTFSATSSRIGMKLNAPEVSGFKPTALFEMDFGGNQPAIAQASGTTEATFFTNATPRIRHFSFKVENPYVDILIGQYWQLFGWQASYLPNSVQTQGTPGVVFGRAPQVRLSHTFKTEPVNIEIAVAATRPVQRDSAIPDGQGGLRVIVNGWKGVHTVASTGTSVDPLSIGVSGIVRRFAVNDFVATPTMHHTKTGWGVSVSGLIPVIPATPKERGNSLSLLGSFTTGTGINDMFSSLTGGAAFGSLPASADGTARTWPQNVDNGLVVYDANGVLHTIDWQAYTGNLQYYLPPSGNVWISLNYGHVESKNIASFGLPAAKIYTKADWADACLFWDPMKPLRFGIEYAYFRQEYADGVKAESHRGQFSGFYLF